jgi:hypothetical protein
VNIVAGGNASFVGGSLNAVRVDHAVGNNSLHGSANVSVNAGNNMQRWQS